MDNPIPIALGDRQAFEVKTWFAKQHNLYTRALEGTVQVIRPKAILFTNVHATTAPSANCHRCGRMIENPVSIQVGYGLVCCEYLGITRPELDNNQLEMMRKKIAETTFTKELWVPRSTILKMEKLENPEK